VGSSTRLMPWAPPTTSSPWTLMWVAGFEWVV
jgi:hypothetical protein